MKETRYLVVGGGMAGEAACVGIREIDADGEIVVLGAEPSPPYARPPLSKALWKGDDESSVWYAIDDLGIELALGREAVALDLGERIVEDDQGERYRYERLLLATGGRPRRLPF